MKKIVNSLLLIATIAGQSALAMEADRWFVGRAIQGTLNGIDNARQGVLRWWDPGEARAQELAKKAIRSEREQRFLNTRLSSAITEGSYNQALRALKNGANNAHYLMPDAIGTGQVELVKLLCKYGASIHHNLDHGNTPLMIATRQWMYPNQSPRYDNFPVLYLLDPATNAEGSDKEEAHKKRDNLGMIMEYFVKNGALFKNSAFLHDREKEMNLFTQITPSTLLEKLENNIDSESSEDRERLDALRKRVHTLHEKLFGLQEENRSKAFDLAAVLSRGGLPASIVENIIERIWPIFRNPQPKLRARQLALEKFAQEIIDRRNNIS